MCLRLFLRKYRRPRARSAPPGLVTRRLLFYTFLYESFDNKSDMNLIILSYITENNFFQLGNLFPKFSYLSLWFPVFSRKIFWSRLAESKSCPFLFRRIMKLGWKPCSCTKIWLAYIFSRGSFHFFSQADYRKYTFIGNILMRRLRVFRTL